MEQALPRAARIVHQGLLPWGNGISVPPGHGCGRAQELSVMRQGGNNTQMLSYTAPVPAGVREGSGTSAACYDAYEQRRAHRDRCLPLKTKQMQVALNRFPLGKRSCIIQ